MKPLVRKIALLVAVSSQFALAAEKPNILLIMADDLGWGDVGFNGNAEIKTPALDQMAKDGMRLGQFYAAAPLCSPTRGSCLTGRYPWRFGILAAHTAGMRVAETTVAEVAHKAGYRTGFFGKWHLGWVKPDETSSRGFYSPPWHHGFDETFATTSAVPTWNPTVTPAKETGAKETGSSKPGEPWKGGMPYVHNGKEVSENMQGDDSRVIMDRVIPFIRESAQEKKPFLACVWFHTPHEPVYAGPEYLALYKDYPNMGARRRNYYGAISAMDEQIGRLRTELRTLGIEKNTVIFFTSDNGPADGLAKKGIASAGPFRGHKHTMFEGGLRVPSLIVWPDHVKAGSDSDAITGTVDYFPTVVDLTGALLGKKNTIPIDGISMLPLMNGDARERTTPLFFGYRRLVSHIDGQALIEDRYKLLKSASPNGDFELYDLQEDPAEKTNILTSKPEIAERMKATMAATDESCRRSRDGADYKY